MLKESDISEFYRHVDELKLRFPVAAIARATGASKGNVSDYLKKRKEPSENFLKKFYSQFPISTTKVPREINGAIPPGEDEVDDRKLIKLLMQQMTNLMQTQNSLLRDQKEHVVDKMDRIDANLNTALGIIHEVSLNVASAREVGLKSLARLENRPEAELFHEAGNNAVQRMKERRRPRNTPDGGK